jgi:hypothetical protein
VVLKTVAVGFKRCQARALRHHAVTVGPTPAPTWDCSLIILQTAPQRHPKRIGDGDIVKLIKEWEDIGGIGLARWGLDASSRMSALGQKRPFASGQPNICIAPIAGIR